MPQISAPPALFADRTWAGPVWIPADADFDEFTAAQSLAAACEQVTGVRPDVREEPRDGEPAGEGLFLGRTRAAAADGVAAVDGDGDTAVRRTIGRRLHIVGNSPVATAIAAGRFCEQALGMTFVMPGVDGVDFASLDRVEWPADETWTPVFAWRSVSGLDDAESIEWGRRVGYGRRPECTHGLYAAFGPALYASRPELFPMVGGERRAPTAGGRSAQPNLAHPDAAAVAAAHLRAQFTRQPSLRVAPLGINDSLVYDEGPEAAWKGLFDGRPNRSDYVFGFLNRVAALDWNPGGDRAIGCLAYLDAAAAPSFPVAPDIFPAVCADRIQYANPRYAAMESANLAAWGKSGARRVGTWDYLFGRDVVIPRWHLGALARSVTAARDARVRSWFAELEPLWAYDAPKAWVAAKLLDRPDANREALADEWARAAYGPAAPAMRSLQRRIESVWADVVARRTDGRWLVGWRDGCAAGELLSPSLEQGAARALKVAREALDAAPRDARHARMRARLDQFEVAWRASVAEARRCRLANAIGAGTYDRTRSPIDLWREMLDAEVARDRALATLNRSLWAGSQPVRWSSALQPNPWPLLAARLGKAEREAFVLPAEAPAAARVALALARQPDAPRAVLARGIPTKYAAGKGWTERLMPPMGVAASAAYLSLVAPQGRIFRRFDVAPGETLRVTVDAEAAASFIEGTATLEIRFPEAPKPPAIQPLHAPAPPPVSAALPYAVRIWGRTVLEVPVGENTGTVAEVELAFVGKLPPVRDVTVERISPRR